MTHLQVFAYPVMDVLHVQVTSGDAHDTGYKWAHLILETVGTGALDPEDPWDMIWLVGHLMCERALERGGPRTP